MSQSARSAAKSSAALIRAAVIHGSPGLREADHSGRMSGTSSARTATRPLRRPNPSETREQVRTVIAMFPSDPVSSAGPVFRVADREVRSETQRLETQMGRPARKALRRALQGAAGGSGSGVTVGWEARTVGEAVADPGPDRDAAVGQAANQKGDAGKRENRLDHAASSEGSGDASGRGTSVGHSAPSGQFAENQAMARSKVRIPMSRPSATPSNRFPSLKTIVETRDRLRAVSRP